MLTTHRVKLDVARKGYTVPDEDEDRETFFVVIEYSYHFNGKNWVGRVVGVLMALDGDDAHKKSERWINQEKIRLEAKAKWLNVDFSISVHTVREYKKYRDRPGFSVHKIKPLPVVTITDGLIIKRVK